MIYQRLSNLSSDMYVFNDGVELYSEAPKNSGFDNLKGYMNSEFIRKIKIKRRKSGNVTFFNPFCNSEKN